MQNRKKEGFLDQETKLKLMHVPLYLGHESREAMIRQRLGGNGETNYGGTDITSSSGLVNRTRSVTPPRKSSGLLNKGSVKVKSNPLEVVPVPRTAEENAI